MAHSPIHGTHFALPALKCNKIRNRISAAHSPSKSYYFCYFIPMSTVRSTIPCFFPRLPYMEIVFDIADGAGEPLPNLKIWSAKPK